MSRGPKTIKRQSLQQRNFYMKASAIIGIVLVTFLLFPSLVTAQGQPSSRAQAHMKAVPDVMSRPTKLAKAVGMVSADTQTPPPDYSSCLETIGIACYGPQQMREAYSLTSVLNAGYTGVGQTIIIVDSFGSPTIAQDLRTFDAAYGLPDPPSFTVLAPLGTVPFDPTNSDQVSWAFETTLDVEWAHAMAPGASIVLLTSPVDETEGVQGMPEFLSLEKYALDHNLGKIISQSWTATENTLFTPDGQQVFEHFEQLYQRAAQNNVTVLCAAGDTGSAGYSDATFTQYYPFPVVGFPASSPLVTAVGGTGLYADSNGEYQYESVWSDGTTVWFYTPLNPGNSDGSGGVSQQFSEPSYQSVLPALVQQTLNHHRGIPDVAYNAGSFAWVLVYLSFFPNPDFNGWYFSGGTSAGSPQWAGIVADANQLAGHPLGFLNPKLYSLGAADQRSVLFHDIKFGSNAFPYAGVPGYLATPGWDLTTGWGTPKADKLIRALADNQNQQ
jgi:subtilase family serine protease